MDQKRAFDMATAIVCAGAIIAAVWATRETWAANAQRESVARQVAAARHANAVTKARADAAEKDAAAVRAAIAAHRPALPAARPPSPSQSVTARTAEAIRQNPQLMAAAREDRQCRIERTYGPLFRQLHLSPDQIRRFEQIIAEEQALVANSYLLEPAPPDAQAVAAEKLEALLGSNYDAYRQYKDSLPARGDVEEFAAELAGVDPLSPTETQQMLQLYAAARDKARQRVTAQGGGTYGATEIYQEVIANARAVLTPQQFEVLQLVGTRDSGGEIQAP